jgi:hypothetical protein
MAFSVRSVLTVDIVDFSLKSGKEQMKAIKALIRMLGQAIPEDQRGPGAYLWSPAGDGGSITFLDDIRAALPTAISLGKLVAEYNKTLPKNALALQVRIGLHSGPVSKETDFDGRENIWGDGINMSARVAGMAKPDQILASSDFHKAAELKTRSEDEASPIGKWWAKHNQGIRLYNIYIDGVGIPPSKVEEWYGPFHYPLQVAINTYETMVEEEANVTKNAYRAAVLAKRLLDLKPQHTRAREIIESISEERFSITPGEKHLFHIFFSKLSPNALTHFFRNAAFREFEEKETIIREGTKADSMMMVVSGEIELYRGTERMKDPKDPKGEALLVSREGDIIGEMGLFNPGERRTATLKAAKKTITLNLDYNFLRVVEGAENEENITRREIQDQIWRFYCRRTIENQVSISPLFEGLSSPQRYRLRAKSEFLPYHYEHSIQLDTKTAWSFWFIVVAGTIIVEPSDSQETKVTFGPGDCLGPVRLLGYETPPYSDITVSPNTHLIRFPWQIVEDLINESEKFEDNCFREARNIRRRLGLPFR